MSRKLKLSIAAVMTAIVTTMGVSTAAIADVGIADAKDRGWCC